MTCSFRHLLRRAVSGALLSAVAFASVAAEEADRGMPARVQAEAILAQARAEIRDQHLDRGRTLLKQANALDPANEAIVKELVRVDALIAGAQIPAPAATDAGVLKRQIAAVDARLYMQRAELLAQSGKYEEADEQLASARAALAPVAADDAEAREQLRRIDGLGKQYDEQHKDRLEKARNRDERRVAAEEKAGVEAAQGRSLLDERLARIAALKERHLFELALSNCRQLLRDFPGEPRAEAAFTELLAATHDQRRLDFDQRQTELRQEVAERLERSLIPAGFDGDPIYPSDWHLRHKQLTGLEAEVKLPAWHEALLDRLAKRVTFDYDSVDLVDAANLLAKQGLINIVVDPALVASEHKITLRADSMRLDSALSWITRLSDTKWSIYNGAVYIGDQGDTAVVTSVYDISDLAFPAVDQAGMTIGYSTQGTNGSFNIFEQSKEATPTVSPEDVVDLIRSSVSPETWNNDANGIIIRGYTLFVTAPATTHILLREFLNSQAHARNILVHIDAKWLEINDSYLEEIGVNWGSSAAILQVPGRNGRFDPGFNEGGRNHEFTGNVTNNLPGLLTTANPATANSGLSLNVMRLGNAQVAAVISAVERKNQGRVLNSPSIATLNGVRGSCFFGTQLAYISDYEVVSSNLDPVISVLNIGANLDIKPFVSADRKHVFMEFKPALASASFFVDVINAPRVFDDFDNINQLVTNAFPIELPNVALQEVATTLDVPDRATILVGGFGRHIEESASAKVPFLGHIPYLGRLFGRRGRYSDRSQLYLLATVHVINYQEAEARL